MTQLQTTDNSQKKLVSRMAERFGVEETKLLSTLKSTAFKVQGGEATNEQMMALMIVADQHGLNPFLKEIYAFPDKGGIVPVVGVDGWARIINQHPQFDGMEFEQDDKSCTCIIYRKDRNHAIRVTEYLSECGRGTGPWKSHPRRMLRHKAMIQCARLAFSFAGIYDPDEAERIQEATEAEVSTTPAETKREVYPDERLDASLEKWRPSVEAGDRSPDEIIAQIETRFDVTDAQRKKIEDLAVTEGEFTEQEGEAA